MSPPPSSPASPGPAGKKVFEIGGRTVGADGTLFLIAGPDLAEPEALCTRIAARVARACERRGIVYIFKGSFDKANRTSASSYRGPGIEAGLRVLKRVREYSGVPVLTDVHEVWQVERVAEVADVLQVPAFLCRQTDLVAACAKTGKVVNVKKGQFLAPWDAQKIAEKVEAAGGSKLILTERGTCFGYNLLVNDLRSIPIMKRGTGYPVCYDATHSQQTPAARGSASGGMPEFIAPMARAAVAAGADGVFLEVHENPASSPVDPETHFPVEALDPLLDDLLAIRNVVAPSRAPKKAPFRTV